MAAAPRGERAHGRSGRRARFDNVRVKCLDCERSKIFPVGKLLPRHAGKIIGPLRPRCDDCFRRRRRDVGLHQPGYGTYIEIVWPDDRR